jgi:hypothetical protein
VFLHLWEESKKFFNGLHEPDFTDMMESTILISKDTSDIRNARYILVHILIFLLYEKVVPTVCAGRGMRRQP